MGRCHSINANRQSVRSSAVHYFCSAESMAIKSNQVLNIAKVLKSSVIALLYFSHIPEVIGAPVMDHWPVIQQTFFAGRTVQLNPAYIQIEAPLQAEDAAVVPVAIQIDIPDVHNVHIARIYLFTDANPIVHTATFSPQQPVRQFKLATRIRLESNSQFRVIVEDSQGHLFMHAVPIKTPGGGCGGGLTADEAMLRATSGEMKVQPHWLAAPALPEISFYIKHPMRTGFERTTQGYYAKAWYINHLAFQLNQQAFLQAELGPGISANPYMRFALTSIDSAELLVEAKDNEGKVFHQSFVIGKQP